MLHKVELQTIRTKEYNLKLYIECLVIYVLIQYRDIFIFVTQNFRFFGSYVNLN